MRTKRTTKIVDSLNSLNKTDVYSLMLFILYKMKDTKEYSTLCELAYLLNGEDLSNLLQYYGGMTITIPTLKEMRLILQGLRIYDYVNNQQGDLNEAIKVSSSDEFSEKELVEIYLKIIEVIKNYNFERS